MNMLPSCFIVLLVPNEVKAPNYEVVYSFYGVDAEACFSAIVKRKLLRHQRTAHHLGSLGTEWPDIPTRHHIASVRETLFNSS